MSDDEERRKKLIDSLFQARLELDKAYCALRRTRLRLNKIENDLRIRSNSVSATTYVI